MLIKLGSRGQRVTQIQTLLGLKTDGVFGPNTELAVKLWQKKNGLKPDGIVGPKTWKKISEVDTDFTTLNKGNKHQTFSKTEFITKNGLDVIEFFMPTDEYKSGPIRPEYIFLHHTAGWNNPFNTITQWANDDRGRIATEFVLGGQKINDNNDTYDGVMVQSFPKGNWGYHLGRNGSNHMHINSVGIELCNFGWVKNGLTWANVRADESQIVKLSKSFRGHREWHRYSDKQLKSLELWLKWIAERDNIDIREGLPKLIKSHGTGAFEFNKDAYYGKIRGVLSHTNTRKDKFDVFPQQELMDMLTSL